MRTVIRATVIGLLGALLASVASAETVGWRNDGTGLFPKTRPPVEWSKDRNVLWKVRLPGGSYGAPILAGERLFVVSDPAELLCIQPSDGKVLWKQTSSYVEALGADKAREIKEEYTRLEGERNKLSRDESKLKKEAPDDKAGLEKLRDRRKAVEKLLNELQRKYRRETGGGSGNSAATPTSDGKHVAAVYGSGIVSVFTVEGKRLWTKHIESPTLGFGHSASPVLLGDKFVVHLKDLLALEVSTGKEIWRTPLPESHASPLLTRLGGEDVLVTPSGAVVRASDGKVLGKGKVGSDESSPVVRDGVVYISRPGQVGAYRLDRQDDKATVKEAWKANAAGDRRTPSSLLHDGLLYAVNTNGMLDVADARTGEVVYRQRLPVQQVFSSVALAGGNLYVFDTRGKAVVFAPGREYKQVAVNQLEGTGACPLFAGDRLYLRGQQHLYCIGTKGDGGK